jgi:heat shock protein HtpX
MIGTLALLIGASTLFFAIILPLIGVTNLFVIMFFVVIFNIIQWLIAPYIINALYGVKELSENEAPWLYSTVRRICRKVGLKEPRLMLANIPIPNAFAYGSPLTGNMVAVTRGLLDTLEEEEVEAVVGHELGHLKHRDVQVMMFASVLPAIFYYLGYSLMMSAWFGDRRRQGGEAIIIGLAAMAIYWILSLLVLGLSRLREYYADAFSAENVSDGARKLSEGLAKIVLGTTRIKQRYGNVQSVGAFKALFISDPDNAEQQAGFMRGERMFRDDSELVRRVLSRKITTFDRIVELFSTHPNIVKRIRALQKFAATS